MELLDHFHPPLSQQRHWHSFHNAWATYIAADFNQRLPAGYFAEPNVHFGIEIDVAAFEEAIDLLQPAPILSSVLPWPAQPASWAPPAPTQTIPLQIITDIAEVTIFAAEGGPTLVGAIELVSPANKDRSSHRAAFTTKCEAYLRQGIGLVMVDIVTGRAANLHQELLTRLNAADAAQANTHLYAAAYRAVEHDAQSSLDIWFETLAIGQPLPTLPLWLQGSICLPVDLASTYDRTCREQRIHPINYDLGD